MKRYGNLFDSTFSRENLYQAYLEARRGKRKKRACFVFETNLGGNLEALFFELHSGCYRPRPYHVFTITEPKTRIIHAPAFRDRVVQHAIYRVISPIFDRTFIEQSFACRQGYGTHKAADYAQRALRACEPDSYTLKLDIRKFFYRIDRNRLRLMVDRKIKDHRLVDIMMMFAECETPVGIPIGNLLSQIFALIYLNPLDHFIKRQLKAKHYCRYVDDFILFGLTRDECLQARQQIIDYIRDELGLELSKSTIQKVKRGVNFVGYRTWQGHRFIRKHSLYKFRKNLKQGNIKGVVSILGHAKNTNSLPYMLQQIQEATHAIPLPKNNRRIHHTHRHAA